MFGSATAFVERLFRTKSPFGERSMDDRFKASLIGIADEGELSLDYLQGFRRGLQRGLYGIKTVADAEHDAWLHLAKDGQCTGTERSRGYADGLQVAVEARGSEA